MNDQTMKTNIISVEYTDKIKRNERKTSGENFIFLDISQKMIIQLQRRETTKLFLDAIGTWRNSLFILIGQCLYVNFHLYNENKPLEPETSLEEKFLYRIYSIEGKIPSCILSCKPAIAVKDGENWHVVKKGSLVLKA